MSRQHMAMLMPYIHLGNQELEIFNLQLTTLKIFHKLIESSIMEILYLTYLFPRLVSSTLALNNGIKIICKLIQPVKEILQVAPIPCRTQL